MRPECNQQAACNMGNNDKMGQQANCDRGDKHRLKHKVCKGIQVQREFHPFPDQYEPFTRKTAGIVRMMMTKSPAKLRDST